MFLVLLSFWATGPNSHLCPEVSEVLENHSPNNVQRQRSRIDWTLTQTYWASVAEFLGRTVEMNVEFFPG